MAQLISTLKSVHIALFVCSLLLFLFLAYKSKFKGREAISILTFVFLQISIEGFFYWNYIGENGGNLDRNIMFYGYLLDVICLIPVFVLIIAIYSLMLPKLDALRYRAKRWSRFLYTNAISSWFFGVLLLPTVLLSQFFKFTTDLISQINAFGNAHPLGWEISIFLEWTILCILLIFLFSTAWIKIKNRKFKNILISIALALPFLAVTTGISFFTYYSNPINLHPVFVLFYVLGNFAASVLSITIIITALYQVLRDRSGELAKAKIGDLTIGLMYMFVLVLTATASLCFSFGSLPLAHALGSLNDNNLLPEVWAWIANVAVVSAVIIFGNLVITRIKSRGGRQSGNNPIEASSFFAIVNKKWDKITKW